VAVVANAVSLSADWTLPGVSRPCCCLRCSQSSCLRSLEVRNAVTGEKRTGLRERPPAGFSTAVSLREVEECWPLD
jgi:hypothetical protein